MRYVLCLAVLFGMLATTSAHAVDGVTDNEVVIGISNAQEGPARLLGTELSRGAAACFRQVEARGGIFGRSVVVVQYDDGYEPEQCLFNTKKLLNEGKVFALFGYVGTPTSKAVLPLVTRQRVPFFFPFTGAGFLRDVSIAPTVFNLRGTYDMETQAMVDYLSKQGKKRIAIFYQDDSFGRAGLAGAQRALKKQNMNLVAEGTYPRNTTAVNRGLLAILKAQPEAVIMIGVYQPCAEFIKRARKLGLNNTTFLNISFVGSNALAAALGPDGDGVLVTQVVPFPWNTKIPAVRTYQAAMRQEDPAFQPSFVTFEGYLDAMLLVEILRRSGRDLTRERAIRAAEDLESLDLVLDSEVGFTAFNHQGLKKVYMSMIKNGGFVEAVP